MLTRSHGRAAARRRAARGRRRRGLEPGPAARSGHALPPHHPVLHPVRRVVVVDLHLADRDPALVEPPGQHRQRSAGRSPAAPSPCVDVQRGQARPGRRSRAACSSPSSNAAARSSRWPGAFSVRRRRPVGDDEQVAAVEVGASGRAATPRSSAAPRVVGEHPRPRARARRRPAAHAARRSATGSSSPAYSGSSARHRPAPARRGAHCQPPDRALRAAAPGDRADHVDGLAGLDDLVHAVDPRARPARRPRSRPACRSAARRPAGRGSRRRSPCWTARPAPASRWRPSRRGGG